MTTKELAKLTPKQKRVRICLAMKWPHTEDGIWMKWDGGDQRNPIDPLSSLDAMHEAAMHLRKCDRLKYAMYHKLLEQIVCTENGNVMHGIMTADATAAQRAEAFLLTI